LLAKPALPEIFAFVHQGIENALLVKLTERKEFSSQRGERENRG